MPPIPLLVVNCHHFATDHLHTVKTLIFYRCHFQLSSLRNWPSSQVCPVYKIPSLGVKNTSSVLWSSANFCSISQNMHYKDPVTSQHWKTNKVVWTWKDDWLPWRTSTYKRPFTWERNYLVFLFTTNDRMDTCHCYVYMLCLINFKIQCHNMVSYLLPSSSP